jgi:anaerobic selenocysteine-containing dehydrogenase
MCGACCGVRVTVEDGGALRLSGDLTHPVSRGYVCPKGRRMTGMIDDPAVLNEPMMRDSRGRLVPAEQRAQRQDRRDSTLMEGAAGPGRGQGPAVGLMLATVADPQTGLIAPDRVRGACTAAGIRQ